MSEREALDWEQVDIITKGTGSGVDDDVYRVVVWRARPGEWWSSILYASTGVMVRLVSSQGSMDLEFCGPFRWWVKWRAATWVRKQARVRVTEAARHAAIRATNEEEMG